MENYLTQITNYLLTQSWQIAVLVVVIAAVTLALKNRSAHVRYLLWLIVLAKCLVPPLVTIPLAILPQDKMPEPTLISSGEMPAVNVEMAETVTSEPIALPSLPVTSPTIMERLARVTARQWLGFGWIVGVAAFLLFALVKALRTDFWLWRQRKLLPAEAQTGIENLFSGLGIKVFPKVWLLDGIGQPFVWGLLRGSIYLPADFVKVNSAEHHRGILGHELSHVLRFDAAVNLLQIIVQAVFWFHPFVWAASKKIRAEREKCCDEMAIARFGAKAKDYSDAIVNILIAEHESTRPVPSLAIAGPVKNIEERIKTMMRPGKKFHQRPSLIAVTIVLLLAVLTVPNALVLTAQAETKILDEHEEISPWSLRHAAADGDIERVKSIILKGADLNAKDEDGLTPLHLAAKSGHNNIIELLIEKGADINTREGRWGGTPLNAAIWGRHKDIAELLIAKGADVKAKGHYGWTVLHDAAFHGQTDIAKLLIAKGADTNARAKSWAVTPLHASAGRKDLVELLIAKGANLSDFHLAAYMGDLPKVKALIAEGTDVNARDGAGWMPLHWAVRAGQRNIAAFLIDKGADVNAENDLGMPPIHFAVTAGHKDIVDFLIAKGANVDGKNSGETLLHRAIRSGHKDVAKLLIAKGADLSESTRWSGTPLHLAAGWGRKDIAVLLIAKGADVNATQSPGGRDSRPLHHAATGGHKEVAEVLIANGADINEQDRSGSTPLHYTCRHNRIDMAEFLIAKGADINARDNQGQTPIRWAKDRGYAEIVELLHKHGAKE